MTQPIVVSAETEKKLALLRAKAKAIVEAGFQGLNEYERTKLIASAALADTSIRNGRIKPSDLWDCCEESQEEILKMVPHPDRPEDKAKVKTIRANLEKEFGASRARDI